MAPPIKHDLTDFRSWLAEERNMAPVGTRGYAGAVSAVLTRLAGDHSPEAITRLFAQLQDKPSYSNYRTAWRAYAEYKKASGQALALPVSEKEVAQPAPLPPAALSLAIALRAAGLSAVELQGITWEQLRTNGQICHVAVVDREIRVTTDLVQSWQEASGLTSGPLFPSTLGSTRPYSARALAEQIRNALLQEDASLVAATTPAANVSLEDLRAAWIAENGSPKEEESEEEAAGTLSSLDLVRMLEQETSPDACRICGFSLATHGESDGLQDGSLYGCAQEEGRNPSSCVLCRGKCPGKHYFSHF